jgi:Uma2 family endonuclease
MGEQVREKIRLTYREYRHFPDDGKRHEIIDGDHYVSPSPNTRHQAASRWIQMQLFRQIEEIGTGYVIDAPMDVELTDYDIVQPDIIVVAESRRLVIKPVRVIGVPDLLVEILSPSNPQHDRELKLALYERVQVPEYWIVDTGAQIVDRYSLVEGRYGEPRRETKNIDYRRLEMSAAVDLNRVWMAL